MRVIRISAGVLVAALLTVVASAKPAVRSDVTAVGFTEWTGVSEKNHLAGRLVCSSDLRHKVTIAVVLESDAKLRDQLAIVSTIMPRIHHAAPESGIDGWAVPRDYVGIVSCRGAVTREALGAALKPVANEPQDITEAIRLVVGSGSGAFRDADFVGAADPAGKCPYVYVFGPTGNVPIWHGTLTHMSVPEAKAAIAKGKKEMDSWETKWRPFYGNIAEPRFFPELAKALEKGRTAKSCPLDPIAKSILADVTSKDEARAKEAQVLYDAVNQTRSDLMHRISLEAGRYPHVALADMAELFKYWPGEKKAMKELQTRLKANPDVEMFARLYSKAREWSSSDFRCKSAGEAKKIVVELNKMKKQIAKHKESTNIVIQNAALAMDVKLDALIATIPESVGK